MVYGSDLKTYESKWFEESKYNIGLKRAREEKVKITEVVSCTYVKNMAKHKCLSLINRSESKKENKIKIISVSDTTCRLNFKFPNINIPHISHKNYATHSNVH